MTLHRPERRKSAAALAARPAPGYRRRVIGSAGRRGAGALGALETVFENRDLRRLQLAWAGMSFSTWAFAIALGVYAFDVGGAVAVGIAGLVRLLPGALASPFGGLLGDRHSRRDVLVASAVSAAGALGAAAVAAAAGAPAAVVFALAGLFTVASSAYAPAEGALLPVVSRTPQELSAGNVAHSLMDNVGFLAGAMLSGVLLATTSPEAVFALAALVGAWTAVTLARVSRDRRPVHLDGAVTPGVLRETGVGLSAVLASPRLRLVVAALSLLVFFEGAADVLIVLVALDLLGLGEGSVGYMNAAWGVGALLGAGVLTLMLHRGRLAAGLVVGSLAVGVAAALPATWPVPVAAYAAWLAIGAGYTFVEVVARTLLQRLGSDEVLGRALGFMESSRFAAMALGSITVPALVAVVGVRGALLALGAILPLFAALRWGSLRALEIGAPVPERRYALLRADPIFAPLPVATLEGLSRDLVEVEAAAGDQIITQGHRGDRFYLVEDGQVEVWQDDAFCRTHEPGGSFGETALLRDVPRTATVRARGPARLLALERKQFIGAVAGHVRSRQAADAVIDERLPRSPAVRS